MERYEVGASPLMYTLLVYDKERGQSYENKTRYTCSLLLTDLLLGWCRIHFAHGNLNDAINRKIFETCKRLGFTRAQFEVPEGTSATRYGKHVATADHFDRYEVDLEEF